MRLSKLALQISMLALWSLQATATSRQEELFQRMTGTEPTTAETLQLNKAKLSDDALVQKLFAHKDFANTRLATLVSKMSNEEADPFTDTDDFQAAMLLSITQDLDFREVFTRPFYIATQKAPNLALDPRRDNYLVPKKLDSVQELSKRYVVVTGTTPQNQADPNRATNAGIPGFYQGGLFTTQGFADRYIKAGTNRRNIRAIYDIFLCSKIESWKDATLDHFYIGRDLDRAPGDNPEEFQSRCAACHAPMDAQRGAFAYYDYEAIMRELRKSDRVVEKYNQNGDVFRQGFVTADDSWENLLVTPDSQLRFGWRGPTKGRGPLSFARMISDSRQFQTCMTKRVVAEFCDKSNTEIAELIITPEFTKLSDSFRQNNYKVKSLIKNVVTSDLCK